MNDADSWRRRGLDAAVISVVVGVIVVVGNTVVPNWISAADKVPLTALEISNLKEKSAEFRASMRSELEKLRHDRREEKKENREALAALTSAVTDLRLEVQRLRTSIPFLVPGARPQPQHLADDGAVD